MSMRGILIRCIASVVAVSVAVAASAQEATPLSQQSTLSRKAQAIKQKVEQLPEGARISVIPLQGEEVFGELLRRGADSFTFRDVDRQTEVTLNYSDVKKIKKGYGGFNTATGRHTDHTRAVVFTCAVLGALGVLIGAAASARN